MPEYFGEAISILQTIRAYHEDVPCVIAANKQDQPHAWSANDVRIGLGIPGDIPVVPCVANQFKSVRDVVIELLYKIFYGNEKP
jgi:signal recognition particle receptor subunit beta